MSTAEPPGLFAIFLLVALLFAAAAFRAFEVNRYLFREEVYAFAFSDSPVSAAAILRLYCDAYRKRPEAMSTRELGRLERRYLAAVTELLVNEDVVRRVSVARLNAMHGAASTLRAELLRNRVEGQSAR